MCSSAVSEQDYLSFHPEMLFKALDQNCIYDLGHHLQSLMTSILIIIFDFQSNYHMNDFDCFCFFPFILFVCLIVPDLDSSFPVILRLPLVSVFNFIPLKT